MNAKVLGFFSGFPARHFPRDIAGQLNAELDVRDSLVFISAWPSDAERNDADSEGMHGMFAECGMPFEHCHVIDSRTPARDAVRLIRGASCIFLMGGNATQQFQLICEKGIKDEIRSSRAVILGVSAGASNMARRALDIWESHVPYDGLGLADITVKAHVGPENQELLRTLLLISGKHELPICAMDDESAIFIKEGRAACVGRISLISGGSISPLTPEMLEHMAAG